MPSNIVTPDFQSDLTLAAIAKIIDDTITSYLENEGELEEYVKLNIAAAENAIPYLPFDLGAMQAPKPKCVYTNNQMKFRVYELDFGCGKPLLAFPNDLPDQFKFWPSTPEMPGVQIYLGGDLAKRYKKLKDSEKPLEQFLKTLK